MTQYIDKSAVVAEINRRLDVLSKDRDFNYPQIKELEALLSSLDALEVKEVDLDNEKDAYICNHFSEGSDGGMISDAYREIGGVTYFDLSNIAEYFFELGLKKAQKGG